MSLAVEKSTAPIYLDTQQIFIATIPQKEKKYLMHSLNQDLKESELQTHLYIATTILKKTQQFGYTRTAGNTLSYE